MSAGPAPGVSGVSGVLLFHARRKSVPKTPREAPIRTWGDGETPETPETPGTGNTSPLDPPERRTDPAEQAVCDRLAALLERELSRGTPARRRPDHEATRTAGVLWRAHAAYLAKRGEAPEFTAEQLAAAIVARGGEEV